jgi:hypothetical protein
MGGSIPAMAFVDPNWAYHWAERGGMNRQGREEMERQEEIDIRLAVAATLAAGDMSRDPKAVAAYADDLVAAVEARYADRLERVAAEKRFREECKSKAYKLSEEVEPVKALDAKHGALSVEVESLSETIREARKAVKKCNELPKLERSPEMQSTFQRIEEKRREMTAVQNERSEARKKAEAEILAKLLKGETP